MDQLSTRALRSESTQMQLSRAIIRISPWALKLAGSLSSTVDSFKTEVHSRTTRIYFISACGVPETTSANRTHSAVDVEPGCNFVFDMNDAILGATRSNIRIPAISYSSKETELSQGLNKRTVKSTFIRTAVLQSIFPQRKYAVGNSH